ncbi:hypothetical protein FHW69_003230 [Luteibacter sp. Sphag1AF]|uniref:DnaJ domain-containing protein n=1 Tax=Luteibacter sp. Sphag1AF TaxID=2587031 RepID=UPI00161BC280|nr:hypothetical protein [Luteibacter sp. Sphag1AF]
MSGETDFLDLYQKLGVGPDCAVAEFKQAYRRHVAQLHPDRFPGADSANELQGVTAQYSAAMDFLRRHGRLPGASAGPRVTITRDYVSQPLPGRDVREAPASRMRWVLLAAVVIGAVLVWQLDPFATADEGGSAVAVDGVASRSASSSEVPTLTLGMSRDEVRSVQGEPLLMHDDQWDYGPSWIRFEHDRVSDWYSSPMHTLATSQTRPQR